METVITRDRRLWPIGLNELVAGFDWNELTPRSFSTLSVLGQWVLRVSYLNSLSFYAISGSQLSQLNQQFHIFVCIFIDLCISV